MGELELAVWRAALETRWVQRLRQKLIKRGLGSHFKGGYRFRRLMKNESRNWKPMKIQEERREFDEVSVCGSRRRRWLLNCDCGQLVCSFSFSWSVLVNFPSPPPHLLLLLFRFPSFSPIHSGDSDEREEDRQNQSRLDRKQNGGGGGGDDKTAAAAVVAMGEWLLGAGCTVNTRKHTTAVSVKRELRENWEERKRIQRGATFSLSLSLSLSCAHSEREPEFSVLWSAPLRSCCGAHRSLCAYSPRCLLSLPFFSSFDVPPKKVCSVWNGGGKERSRFFDSTLLQQPLPLARKSKSESEFHLSPIDSSGSSFLWFSLFLGRPGATFCCCCGNSVHTDRPREFTLDCLLSVAMAMVMELVKAAGSHHNHNGSISFLPLLPPIPTLSFSTTTTVVVLDCPNCYYCAEEHWQVNTSVHVPLSDWVFEYVSVWVFVCRHLEPSWTLCAATGHVRCRADQPPQRMTK